LAHAGSEVIPKPRFERRPGVEYKLRENGIQSRQLRAAASSTGLKGSEIL